MEDAVTIMDLEEYGRRYALIPPIDYLDFCQFHFTLLCNFFLIFFWLLCAHKNYGAVPI